MTGILIMTFSCIFELCSFYLLYFFRRRMGYAFQATFRQFVDGMYANTSRLYIYI